MKTRLFIMVLFAVILTAASSFAGVDADMVDGKHAADFAPAIHTHNQSDVSGLSAALAGKADSTHSHAQADVSGLEPALAGKADSAHAHAQSDVTGLTTALAGKSDTTHNHDSVYQTKYAKVAFVAQSGGDYTDPVSAMSAVDTWCGTPSASNPCLLKRLCREFTR